MYMGINLQAKDSLSELLKKNYIIKSVEYSENTFGNILVEIINEYFSIRFVYDRKDCFCKIVHLDETYLMDDVFSILNYEVKDNSKNFWEFVKYYSLHIANKNAEINKIFSSEMIDETRTKLKQVSAARVYRLFGIE